MIANKERIEKVRREKRGLHFEERKKRWEENVVAKLDLVPPDAETHYTHLDVKPGFEFYLSLVTAPQIMLNRLDRIRIPDMLYVNYYGYLLSTDSKSGQIWVK